jgi:hypothetical protein
MLHWNKSFWPLAVGFGLVVGLVLGGFWPYIPLHAVSTDRADTYAIATGPVDAEVEAVYLLDFLTGDLGALILGKQPGSWGGFFKTNVAADLAVDPQKNPKFLMVTGVTALRRAGGNRSQFSSACCYVAEITSGRLAAYSIPWANNMYTSGQPQQGALRLVGATHFRQSAGGTPGAGIATPKGKVKEKEKE